MSSELLFILNSTRLLPGLRSANQISRVTTLKSVLHAGPLVFIFSPFIGTSWTLVRF